MEGTTAPLFSTRVNKVTKPSGPVTCFTWWSYRSRREICRFYSYIFYRYRLFFVPLLVWGGVTIIWAEWWRPHRLIDLKFIHTQDIFHLVKISSTLETKAKEMLHLPQPKVARKKEKQQNPLNANYNYDDDMKLYMFQIMYQVIWCTLL